jgi:hypothetical protein
VFDNRVNPFLYSPQAWQSCNSCLCERRRYIGFRRRMYVGRSVQRRELAAERTCPPSLLDRSWKSGHRIVLGIVSD